MIFYLPINTTKGNTNYQKGDVNDWREIESFTKREKIIA